jgi:IstB-like ATP binding protein
LRFPSARYERASVIVTSNKLLGRWGEVFVAAAMIDRLVNHADVVSLKGDSYRLKTETSEECPPTTQGDHHPAPGGQFSPGADISEIRGMVCLTDQGGRKPREGMSAGSSALAAWAS